MDKHETALRELASLLSALDPICSIFAQGSIGRSEYNADSDIDLTVVSWRYKHLADELDWQLEENHSDHPNGAEAKVDSGLFRGIHLDLHCRSPRNHISLIMSGPVYTWGRTRILYDPSGLAKWGVACTERLLADNPDFAQELKVFHDQHQKWKQDKSTVRDFETQLDFGNSIELSELVRNYKTFEHTVMKRKHLRNSVDD